MELLSYDFKQEIRSLIREEMAISTPQPKHETTSEKVFCNQKKACENLQITEPTIIRWRNKGKIPFLKIGSSIRYEMNDVIKALEVNTKKKGVRNA